MTGLWRTLVFMGFMAILTACGTNVSDDFVLDRDETLDANEHLVAVSVDLKRGSTVNGDLNISASDVNLAGDVQGDVTVLTSRLDIDDSATIDGDLVYCLVNEREFFLDDEAVIWGDVLNSCDANTQNIILPSPNENERLALNVVGNLVIALFAGVFAAINAVIMPRRLFRIKRTARQHAPSAIGLGLLTLLMAIGFSSLWGASLALIVPIILIPFFALGWLLLGVLTAFGSVSIAQSVGIWLVHLLRIDDETPVITTTLGTFTLTFVILSLWLVPVLDIVAFILSLWIILWALGAALLTRGGTRTYDRFYR